MILKSHVKCLSVTFVPASQYDKKDGTKGNKPQSWEVLLRYQDNVYSRALKKLVARIKEELHESRVEMQVGDYEVSVEPRIFFDEVQLVVTEAKELKC